MINFVLKGIREDLDTKIRYHWNELARNRVPFYPNEVKRAMNYALVDHIQKNVNEEKYPTEMFWFAVYYCREKTEELIEAEKQR